MGVAQQERDMYREAYQSWRQAETELERDASTGGRTAGARADKAAAAAARYYAARKSYLDAQRSSAEQKTSAIENLPVATEFDATLANYTSAQSTRVGVSIGSVAANPDRGIQRLRQALEEERNALTALSASLSDAERGLAAVKRSNTAIEQLRAKLSVDYQGLAATLRQSVAQTTEVETSWAGYYRALAEASSGSMGRDPVAANVTAPGRVPSTGSTPDNANDTGPDRPARGLRRPSITPLPLYRYVGEWNYPTVGAQFRGPQPESVDLVVREENGQAKGSLLVNFRFVPAGVSESTLRLNFEGSLQPTRTQSFPLVTSTGAKGSVELIPGSAFNLLEVNFKIDTAPYW
jgi:hypothetical protein